MTGVVRPDPPGRRPAIISGHAEVMIRKRASIGSVIGRLESITVRGAFKAGLWVALGGHRINRRMPRPEGRGGIRTPSGAARQRRDSLLEDVQHLRVQGSVLMFGQLLESCVEVVGK